MHADILAYWGLTSHGARLDKPIGLLGDWALAEKGSVFLANP
jgi:hypothetical protein